MINLNFIKEMNLVVVLVQQYIKYNYLKNNMNKYVI